MVTLYINDFKWAFNAHDIPLVLSCSCSLRYQFYNSCLLTLSTSPPSLLSVYDLASKSEEKMAPTTSTN